MEKIQKYLPTPLILLAFLISFVTIYSSASPILQDTDIAWHIVAGDLIRVSGDIAPRDPWSFSGSQQTWYNISWLWDVILSFVHEKLGLQGLFVFAVFLPALLVALLLASLRKNNAYIGINALIFMGMITTYCMLEYATGRPQIMGMFFALIFYHILHKSRRQPRAKLLFLLPLIMILWVNTHGSFFAGFVVLGSFGLEAILAKNKFWFWRLFSVGVLCLVAILVNPYGIYIVIAVMRSMNTVIANYLIEWQPFVFGKIMGISLWLLVFIGFSNLRGNNTQIADKILVIIWLLAMFFAIRNIAMLVILGAPYIAANLPPDNQKDNNTHKLSLWINDLNFSPMLVGLIPLALIISYFLLPVLGTEHYVEKAEKSPLPAIKYVMEHYVGKRVFNDYDYGGRIIYETRGKFPVMVDGRAGTVYTEKILTDFLAFITQEKDWQKILELYKIDIILLGNGRLFVTDYEKGLYHDQWEKVFSDDVSSVFIRK